MTSQTGGADVTKRVGIAIEMGHMIGHHVGTYKGILAYLAEHHPDWQPVLDPYMVGLINRSGVAEYDGVVGRISATSAEQAAAVGVPIVNHWVNSPAQSLPLVCNDSVAGSQIVVEHLLDRGYRRLGLVCFEGDKINEHRLEGMRRALNGMWGDVEILELNYDFESGPKEFVRFYNRLGKLLKGLETPIGLYIPMDLMAVYVMQACGELGLRVPEDVGVVSFFNTPLCVNASPTLSSLEPADEEVGYEAMGLLAGLMLGEAERPSEPVLVAPKTLRVRGSSNVFVSEDEVVARAMTYISERSHEMITVDDVAEAASVSTRTLSRRFDRHVGQTVLGEINRMRLATVKQTLLDTDLPIAAVAEHCGFSSTSHFNVFFRKAVGQTPGAYRKEHLRR